MPSPLRLPSAFTFSQSSLQDYRDCPRRFQLRYIERLAYPAIQSEPALENERRQQAGRAFHRMVQQHRIGLPQDRLSAQAQTPDLQRWWENYLSQDFGLAGCEEHTELVLAAPLGSHRLLAKYDLVAVRPDRMCLLFDWKTYARRPRDEWMAARWQTRVYCMLMVMAGASVNHGDPLEPGQVEMVYWYADHPTQAARFPYTTALYGRDQHSLAELVGEIEADRQFRLTSDERTCSPCPYRSLCERGSLAAANPDEEGGAGEYELDFERVQEVEY